MSMPSYEDAYRRAADRMAFSNGFEIDCWMDRWCYRREDPCRHEPDCPLILVAMEGKTPAEWQEQDRGDLGNQYRCTRFEAAP